MWKAAASRYFKGKYHYVKRKLDETHPEHHGSSSINHTGISLLHPLIMDYDAL